MSNELTPGFSDLLDLAEDMIDGLSDHGGPAGVKQWTGHGTVIAGCDRSPRGRKYRFAIKLAATGTLEVRVAAHNAASDSPWSAGATLNLH